MPPDALIGAARFGTDVPLALTHDPQMRDPLDAEQRIRVLCIDDDEDDFVLCREMLRDIPYRPYEVEWAPTPDAARGALERHAFDVILLDHYLGPVTGLEFLEDLRKRSSGPVVMLTGRASHEIDTAAIRAGASDYLPKGTLTPELLERSIRHAIERRRAERALHASEARYRTLVSSLQEGVLVQDQDGRILTANASAAALLGLDARELIGRTNPPLPLEYVREDGTSFPREERPNRITLRTGQAQSGVVVGIRRADTSLIWVSVNTQPLTRDGDDLPYAVLISFVDVTERVQSHQALTHQAFHDSLTGLPNRKLFMDRLQQALLQAQWSGEVIAVGVADMDRFKTINDRLGHLAGDDLLKQVARRLQRCVREPDTVARLGGDEFTLLLRNVQGPEGASLVAQRVIDAFQRRFLVAGQGVSITLSLGVALMPVDGSEADMLLRNADRAAYRVKAAGRNSFALFTTSLSGAKGRHAHLENDLRGALERDELELHYQPLIDLATGRVVALEALLRWSHPTLGPVAPSEFIPIAEETGLIVPIGTWVLEEACRRAEEWSVEHPGVRVTVNVSPLQFARSDFYSTVQRTLHAVGLAPDQLELELTETLIMTDVETSLEQMAKLKTLGVRLAVDDFGTGYSSLAYLQQLPIDVIKIDRAFIQTLQKPGEQMLVQAITEVGHRLGIETTAEGIETEQQLALLQELGCEYGQGYLLGKPSSRPVFAAAGPEVRELLDGRRGSGDAA